jgi:Inner centromere protein, ARK binding region
MHALQVHNACMAQLTIRKVPLAVERALRRRAKQEDMSLNQVALEALARGAGVTAERVKQRDLDDVVGTWAEDPAFEAALEEQRRIDPELWR